MLLQDPNLKVWLYNHVTDMRKQFTGLAELVQSKLSESSSSGDLFVFLNRRRTQIKILYFSTGGYCLWSKRLEQGRFNNNGYQGDKVALNWAELQCLVEGIDLKNSRKRKRFRP